VGIGESLRPGLRFADLNTDPQNSGALGTRKINLWRVCIPVIADSHHFDEEQDPDPDKH
jgi:hypothetical protein